MRLRSVNDGMPYAAKKAVEAANKEIAKELENPNPDMHKINKINESRYMPGLFSDVMGYYDRFRNPW